MDNNTPVELQKLIEEFEKLPSIGHKTAQRLAFHMLGQPLQRSEQFAQALVAAKKNVHNCKVCYNFSSEDSCKICSDQRRDKEIICVVKDPRDVMAVERTREYNGMYHVLHGLISPVEGIGPDSLYVRELLARLKDDTVKEVIMATDPTTEGEATALYLSKLIKPLGVKVTRIAYGISAGSNLEYTDEVTLYRAIEGRSEL